MRRGGSNPPFRTIAFIFAGDGPRRERFLRSERRGFAGGTYDYFNDDCSHYSLFVSDYCGAFAEWEERGHRGGFRRDGEPDGVWSARRGNGSVAGDDLVGDYFYGDFDYAFGGSFAARGHELRVAGD